MQDLSEGKAQQQQEAEAQRERQQALAREVIHRMREHGQVVLTPADREAFLSIEELSGVRTDGFDSTGNAVDMRLKLWKQFEDLQLGTVMMSTPDNQRIIIYWKGSDSFLRRLDLSTEDISELKATPSEVYRDVKLYGNVRVLPAHGDALRGYQIADADETMDSQNFLHFAQNSERYLLLPKLRAESAERQNLGFADTGL